MATVKVFDPPMCCSTGACGPDPDPALARFASDLQWLAAQGVIVDRYSLSVSPDKFAADPTVLAALKSQGTAILPIVMVDGSVIATTAYPSRDHLAAALGIGQPAAADAAAPISGRCCGESGGCCG